MKQIGMMVILIVVSALIGGCRNESERLADMSEQTVKMQSQQNRTLAEAGFETAKLHRDIQSERRQLNERTNEIEKERQAIHRERRSELAWSESFRFLAIVIAATMPLLLCAFLIWVATRQSTSHEAVNEILIQELVSPIPRLITAPNLPAIERQPATETSNRSTESNNEGDEDDVSYRADQDRDSQ